MIGRLPLVEKSVLEESCREFDARYAHLRPNRTNSAGEETDTPMIDATGRPFGPARSCISSDQYLRSDCKRRYQVGLDREESELFAQFPGHLRPAAIAYRQHPLRTLVRHIIVGHPWVLGQKVSRVADRSDAAVRFNVNLHELGTVIFRPENKHDSWLRAQYAGTSLGNVKLSVEEIAAARSSPTAARKLQYRRARGEYEVEPFMPALIGPKEGPHVRLLRMQRDLQQLKNVSSNSSSLVNWTMDRLGHLPPAVRRRLALRNSSHPTMAGSGSPRFNRTIEQAIEILTCAGREMSNFKERIRRFKPEVQQAAIAGERIKILQRVRASLDASGVLNQTVFESLRENDDVRLALLAQRKPRPSRRFDEAEKMGRKAERRKLAAEASRDDEHRAGEHPHPNK